ncbi:MAG: class I SAM-dependent methyltransferase [Bradyrhizobium sp.]|uniref:class I SAM-dependent methyltransferase n=1 Tax=Bradyrhizobium sp. TaxID=376 RepID=UPI0025BACDBE|nr:class I SAM-dependent methyltransferase [Bradyrhizobium sp.]MBI5262277.1 class I SAM-dependent methyltransferase [Bradyrhizobium sp.]
MFRAWSTLARPVTVSDDVIAAIKAEVSAVTGRIMLLGVTRGLMSAGSNLVAVDRNAGLVRDLSHAAVAPIVVGDWRSLPFPDASFDACIGDGSLISFDPDQLAGVLGEVARCLKPGGKLACRVFMSPDAPETLADVERAVTERRLTFQQFKFKFAMATGMELGNSTTVAVASIPTWFDAAFPDRDRLAALTGWDRAEIDTIDVYRSSPSRYTFPTRSQLLAALPSAFAASRFVAVPTHPFGHEWPVVVLARI